MKLSEYDYKAIFLPSYIRKKSSFGTELWSVLFNKILPNEYAFPDARSLLYNDDVDSFVQRISQIRTAGIDEQNAFLQTIRQDAIVSFNELASLINGEQQNLYIYERLKRLGIGNVSLGQLTDEPEQISQNRTQIKELSHIIEAVRQSYKSDGTAIHLTYRIEKLAADLNQACDVIAVCEPDCSIDEIITILVKLTRRNLLNKGMWHFISSKTEVLTKTIVEHNSVHGGKYIANNLKEYFTIFWASLIGGCMIAVFALFKVEIESWGFSLLGEGLLFGINYALCFMLVDVLGGIIATKQPAMTANTLLTKIALCDSKDAAAKQIANVFADVSKSQFVSFLGNLSVAFFLSILISYLFIQNNEQPLVDNDIGTYLVKRNNIAASGALFYAAVAGVFLSVSGFIAGYMDNAVLFHRLKQRVAQKFSKRSVRLKLYNYVLNKLGKFSGSISLGLLLGLAGAVGMFSGIPFDIRHVAFSSAHIAYGSHAIALDWVSQTGVVTLASIFIIGAVNFIVSFVITLVIALRTTNFKNRDILYGFFIALKVFLLKPWVFILPVGFGNNVKK
ncbi:MAG: hypothetical protein JXX29_05325 [Deltaproteobacteria bacterium]|nr:hypothetical protein [Deltaproteobacteria bacterium]MBN2671069.1 hypothetical protein [Deltaproteobacteria bacterium]